MDIRTLTIEEIRQTYKEHLRYDFPPDELKPLDRIEVSINEGKYLCIGAFGEDGKLVAYAFFVMTGDKCLLDYYAVIPELRGKGIGSAFLSEAIRKADSLRSEPGSALPHRTELPEPQRQQNRW